jgi:prepilin-type N-terminal cleavage/methylation domain-containing protein
MWGLRDKRLDAGCRMLDAGTVSTEFLPTLVKGGRGGFLSRNQKPASSIKHIETSIQKSASAFTLLEVMVAVSIMAIVLVAVVVPRFQDAMAGDDSKKISRWIMAKTQAMKEQAIIAQKTYTLHISLDSGKFWMTTEGMEKEAVQEAEKKGFSLPEEFRVTDVEFPIQGRVTAGRADIRFYKDGYSDNVMIHIEDDDNNQYSFLIEPFLTKVKLYEDYVGFEG